MNQRFKFLSQAGDGAVVVDVEQRILYWNDAAERILGYSAQEAIGRHCYQLFAGRTPECSPLCGARCHTMRQVQQQASVSAFKVVVKHKDGHELLLDISTIAFPEDTAHGEATAVIHLFRLLGEAPAHVARLRIYLLGKVRVQRADGTQLGGKLWRQAKVRALLAYLATQRGGSIPREVLLANLWPDMPEEAARHNLYTAVHNLRRCLEPNLKRATDSRYVLYDDYSYRLNGGIAHWVDAQAFETGIRHARHEPALARATALYADALSLYHGDFLSHLGNTIGWHWQEQERLRTLYLHALEAYAGLLVRQQQLDAACQALEIVLAQDPCRETACYLLMQARWQQGQRALALASYQRLSAALQTELGVSPEAQTRAFYVRIANGA